MAISIASCFGVIAVACGGGDDSGASNNDASTTSDTSTQLDSSGGIDSGGGTESGPSDGGALAPVVYVGQVAALDVSPFAPAGASIVWSIESAPAGSTAALSSTSSATTTLRPDEVGDFVLAASFTSSGASSIVHAVVHSRPGKVLLTHVVSDGGSGYGEISTVRTDGTGLKAVSCPADGFAVLAAGLGSGLDWIEGAPDDDSRIVFVAADDLLDGGIVSYIGAGKISSSCAASPPAHLDAIPPPTSQAGAQRTLHLSPDGSRIAYAKLDDLGAGHIWTLGFDGSSPHELGPITVLSDGDAGGEPTAVARPRWIDATHVAWIELTGATTWSVVSAEDTGIGTIDTLMTCTAVNADPIARYTTGLSGIPQPFVTEFDPLPDGSFLVAVAGAPGASNDLNLVVLRPNASTKACELVHSITSYADGVSYADDFALSPDGTKVAFLAGIGDAGGVLLYAAPLDGGPATNVSSFGDAGTIMNGPRWAAGGSMVVLERGPQTPDGGGEVVSAWPDDNRVDLIVTSTITDQYSVSGNACSIALQRATPVGGIGLVAAFAGLLARRRRRAKRS